MSYWCDDRSFHLQQRQLDAIQQEALKKMERKVPKSILQVDSELASNKAFSALLALCNVEWHNWKKKGDLILLEISGDIVPDAPQCVATVERCLVNNVMQITVRFDAVAPSAT